MIKNDTPLKSRYKSEYRNKSKEASRTRPQYSKSPIARTDQDKDGEETTRQTKITVDRIEISQDKSGERKQAVQPKIRGKEHSQIMSNDFSKNPAMG